MSHHWMACCVCCAVIRWISTALRHLAVLVDLRERTNADIETLCALLGDLDGDGALGAGEDPKEPASLFDRIFNGDPARLSKRFVPSGAAFLPIAYVSWGTLTVSGDLLSDIGDNQEFRDRVRKALALSARDLNTVITRFRDRASARGRVSLLVSVDSRALSILHRVTKLAELTELTPVDLLRLVDVLEKDSGFKTLNAFDVLVHQNIASGDLFQILETGTTDERAWLIQNLIAISAWAKVAGLDIETLESIAATPDENSSAQQAMLRATAQALHEAFLPNALAPELLKPSGIEPRSAGIAIRFVSEPARGLVSPADPRLLTWNEPVARQAAAAWLAQLRAVTVTDLQSLKLGEDLARYLQSLLIRRGVLDANGTLLEERLPAHPEDVTLEPENGMRFDQIFGFLHDLYRDAVANAPAPADTKTASSDLGAGDFIDIAPDEAPTPIAAADETTDNAVEDDTPPAPLDELTADLAAGDVAPDAPDDEEHLNEDVTQPATPVDPHARIELQLHESDLIDLGFDEAETDEWIDRLVALRLIDGSGSVTHPWIFSDTENLPHLRTAWGLDEARAEIVAVLSRQRDGWQNAPLRLPTDLWAELPFSESEIEALEQNLTLNGHIDAQRRIVDKHALGQHTPDTFNLSLQFLRHHRAILATCQRYIAAQRERALRVGLEELRQFADAFIARDIHRALAADLDDDSRLRPEVRAVIESDQPAIDLGPNYAPEQQQRVWTLLQQVEAEASPYLLTDGALGMIGLSGDDAATVLSTLVSGGHLQSDRTLSAEQTAHFLALNNVQGFRVPGFEDYTRDIYLLLHDVARATDAATQALIEALKRIAGAQSQAVMSALGSQVELKPEVAASIVRPLLRDEPRLVAMLLEPVLRAMRETGLAEAPRDRVFCDTLRQLAAFAGFARKLRMNSRQITAAFQDQNLVEKFPEPINLPPGIDGIDVLWPGFGGGPADAAGFTARDFIDLQTLIETLVLPGRPVDRWLTEQLSTATRAAFADEGVDLAAFTDLLRRDLNRVLRGPLVYDPARFADIALRARTKRLLGAATQSTDTQALNRLLIEDAYPRHLVRHEVYLFRGARYWVYDANSLTLNESALPLTAFCPDLADASAIDALYTLPGGEHWLLAAGRAWRRGPADALWSEAAQKTARIFGRVRNRFEDPEHIDAALLDTDGRGYLFSGDQVIRYTGWPADTVDEGFPRHITPSGLDTLGFAQLPAGWEKRDRCRPVPQG